MFKNYFSCKNIPRFIFTFNRFIFCDKNKNERKKKEMAMLFLFNNIYGLSYQFYDVNWLPKIIRKKLCCNDHIKIDETRDFFCELERKTKNTANYVMSKKKKKKKMKTESTAYYRRTDTVYTVNHFILILFTR